MDETINMNFPDLEGKEYETLFIIGNGFDLYHGLDSSYDDFRCWLKQNGHKNFVKMMETMFPKVVDNQNLLWMDFEAALGTYDPLAIHDKFGPHFDDGMFDEAKQKKAIDKIAPTLSNIKPLLSEWASKLTDRISASTVKKLPLRKESRYITFNYTSVLEDFYGIPSDNILHVHGSVAGSDDIVVGHNRTIKPDGIVKGDYQNMKISVGYIVEAMNKLYKNVHKIQEAKFDFFNELYDISRVVVLGHSLSPIDMYYFTCSVKGVEDGTHWHFSAHTEKSVARVCEVMDNYNNKEFKNKMEKENCWIFNF